MGGTHIFFVMPAKVGAGGNQLCAGGPRRPTHASRRGRRGRQAGLLPVWRSPLTLNGPCRREWIQTSPLGAPGFMCC